MHAAVSLRYVAAFFVAFCGMPALSGADSDVIGSTLMTLREYAQPHGADGVWSLSFQISEKDMNAYVKRITEAHQRPGLDGAEVHFRGNGKLGIHVDLDLAEVCAWAKDTCSLAKIEAAGKLSINAEVTVTVARDEMTVGFDSVQAVNLDLPEPVIRSLLAATASHQPEHFEILKPMKLPFSFKQLEFQANMLVGHV